MLSEIRGHVLLGDLTCRPLPQQRRSRSTQPFAFAQKLLVPRELRVHVLQLRIDLAHDATSPTESTATRTTSHENLHDDNENQHAQYTRIMLLSRNHAYMYVGGKRRPLAPASGRPYPP